MSLNRDYDAGYAAGARDSREGRPEGVWHEQSESWKLGYSDGYHQVQLVPGYSRQDFISDSLWLYDLKKEIAEKEAKGEDASLAKAQATLIEFRFEQIREAIESRRKKPD